MQNQKSLKLANFSAVLMQNQKTLKLVIFSAVILLSFLIGRYGTVNYTKSETVLDVTHDKKNNSYFYIQKGKKITISPVLETKSKIHKIHKQKIKIDSSKLSEYVFSFDKNNKKVYKKLEIQKNWGFWSLFPALAAIAIAIAFREPVLALFGGIVAGTFLFGQYDLVAVLLENFSTKKAGGLVFLYLFLMGALLGIWQKTGAAKAFAEFMTKHCVRGPRSAKLVTWFLGVLFFQGGTLSTVVVGTTVKPIADKEKVSHEELSYIVDSTGSPIASQIPFNAWPGYIQALIFVPGVAFLATPDLRYDFFVGSVPFCFYAIFAVLGTFLLSIEKPIFCGKKLREAMKRAREKGTLNAENAEPLNAKELEEIQPPKGYKASVWEFFLPLGALIYMVVTTKDPKIGFASALLVSFVMGAIRGVTTKDLINGGIDGMKGVMGGFVILMLAVTLGALSKQAGGGAYLTDLVLSSGIPYWTLPLFLVGITVIISFSTGTSWGTYALAFPIAMPVAWSMAQAQGLDPSAAQFFMTICFAAVMDGSVFGDQCSPISDTTVLSSMSTGCDLMDHVKTQLPQAVFALVCASVCWLAVTILFV